MSTNPIAEVFDTFFNGRPAPRRAPDRTRIRLSAAHLRALNEGASLRFRTNGTEITVVAAKASRAAAPGKE